jgi:beta-N-acetylhexosaminidase
MVGVDVHNLGHDAYDAIRDRHVGNVFLAGRTEAGRQPVHNLVTWYTGLVSARTTHGTPLFVATDQEGGQVQVLRGPGFSDLPNALDQAILAPATLQANAKTWGTELALAGVNLDLAPVMDLVPGTAAASKNPPIVALNRNYGYTLDSVTSHANAFSAGLESAGVEVSIKHFPGLGRVSANTDTSAGVTDTVTTRGGASVQAFRSGITAGAGVVMTSTAMYTRIDPGVPAAFSPVVVGDVLRGDLGFRGVVISDDLSAATQVLAWSPAQRAIKTIDAGGDIVLVSRDPTVAPQMVDAVVAHARVNPAFAKKVDAAVLRVLAAKSRLTH